MINDEQRRANRRLGWIFAAIALAFAVAYVVKVGLFGF
ncbi:MAG: cytochrome oxidase small assembly protein [Burkholderiales bacterium]|nr:cytochrome oxidase small assembly protein [Burkholderiales bacterium]MDE1927845.1 cytochrome oxidase small assembly protein [Burkholderiales bacterium]MDE2158899.1 cytochrome oxidase small assembly protein [Burkholderiales bacterium]MDE2503318.1 cytochrome oxidase small assembly protein [Burkholderiales bacterium]